jgi:putative phage-type endonuclease
MLTPEQLALRRTGIGGSDAAAICGLSAWATPLDIYFSKIAETLPEETMSMRRGTLLEPFVKSLFEHKTGWKTIEVKDTQRSSEHPFMLANLDGYLPREMAIAEFKTANYASKSDWGEEGTDEMPKEYLIQVAHYAKVMELDKVYVGVLFGGEKLFKAYIALQKIKEAFISYPIEFDELDPDFRIYTYTRSSLLEEKLVKREKSFWFDYVQKQVMPPLEDGCLEDVLKAYPTATDKEVIATENDLIHLSELTQIKHSIKDLEVAQSRLKSDILKIFGDGSILKDHHNQTIATFKNESRSSLDKEAFEKVHPGLLDQFTKTKVTRTLRIL